MRALLSTVNAVIRALPEGTRRFVRVYSALSAALSLLDVVALGLLAYVLPQLLTNSGRYVDLPVLGRLSGGAELVALVAGISLLFIGKSLVALFLTRWGVGRFAVHEVGLADRLMRAYLYAPWAFRLRSSSSRMVRNMDVGLSLTFNGLLMPYSSLISEAASFAAVALVILVAQPVTALTAIAYFGLVALVLYRVLSRRAAHNGAVAAETSTRTVQLVQETAAAMKEIILRGQQDHVAEIVHEVRARSAFARCASFFYGLAPRFVLEAALMGGFLLVGGVAALTGGGLAGAVSAVALFGAAGFRVVPSLTRFQAVLATMHSNEPYGRGIVQDLVATESQERASRARTPVRTQAPSSVGRSPDGDGDDRPPVPGLAAGPVSVELRDVVFRYPGTQVAVLDEVSLSIPAGSRLAIVGSSGSGKTTLVDVILGLLEPESGTIEVGGVALSSVLDSWRRRVGYVPQDVALFDATIAENVALSWRRGDVDDDRVRSALAAAQLGDVVDALPDGIDAAVGERGLRLSGGQRQRLGIARALYVEPQVLVLDEATSALDTATEAAVTDTIAGLAGDVTLIVIAHRLATIRDSDVVAFLDRGRVVASGTFDEVVGAVPDFATQAALAGLVERPPAHEHAVDQL